MANFLDQHGLGQILLSVKAELATLKQDLEHYYAELQGGESGAAMVRLAAPIEQLVMANSTSCSLDGINQNGFWGSGVGMTDSVQCFINDEAIV